ncbi:MAG: hypothetical protein QNL04_11540 [SAR324 cluster bacterium]|nr:hypothetical protein [SAR324 cluster bacterium]
MFRILTLAIFISFLLPSTIWATTGFEGLNLVAAFNVNSNRQSNSETAEKVEETNKIMSTRLGYTMEGGFYLGVIDETQNTNNGILDLKTNNKGGTIGITDKGCYIAYHFLNGSTKELSKTTTLKGKGSGVDFGRQFDLGGALSFGAQLSFRSIVYDISETEGVASAIKFESHSMKPMLTFGLTF